MTRPLPLQQVAIVTCDRPEALRRCLVSHARHARAHGRTVEHVVLSDTRSPAGREAERSMLSGLARESGAIVRYAGSEEKQRFASLLAREVGCQQTLIDFALFGPTGATHTAGANRNAVLLGTTGSKVWMVDDDTVCRPAALRGRRAGGTLRSAHDPTEVRLCTSRDEAIGAVDEVGDDLFAAHDRILGRSASDLVSTGEVAHDGGRPPPAPLLAGRVALSSLGIYGDSGARSSAFCCYRDDRVRAALWESEARHAALSTTREVVRGVRRLTLTLGMHCQSTSIALDNTEPLVPFFPTGRAEDLLFGAMLRADRPQAWFAHQPLSILHAPWETRVADAPVPAAAQPPPGVALIVATVLDAVMAQRPQVALRRLGIDLRVLASMPPADLLRAVAKLLGATLQGRIAALTRQLEAYPDAPPYWSQRLRQHIESWRLRLDATRSASTLQLGGVPTGIAAADIAPWVQRALSRFADLIDIWPHLCAAAARLAERGQGLAPPLRARRRVRQGGRDRRDLSRPPGLQEVLPRARVGTGGRSERPRDRWARVPPLANPLRSRIARR